MSLKALVAHDIHMQAKGGFLMGWKVALYGIDVIMIMSPALLY